MSKTVKPTKTIAYLVYPGVAMLELTGAYAIGQSFLMSRKENYVENGKIINSAGVSAGVDMALFFATRLTGEATARKLQLWLDYDPQPPYGGIDWDDLPITAWGIKTWLTVAAPFIVSRSKRMRKREEAPDQ